MHALTHLCILIFTYRFCAYHTLYEEIKSLIRKPKIYYEDDPGDVHILDVLVNEDHMRCKDEVKESCPLKFDYEGIANFDLG